MTNRVKSTIQISCVQLVSPVYVHRASQMYISMEVIDKKRDFRLMKMT